jgi:peptide/nickel transport system ATP-binding protein
VLVRDEVTSALDVLVQATIVELLAELRRDLGLSMLFVTHNLPLVRSIADTVAVMNNGAIVEFGRVKTLLGIPKRCTPRGSLPTHQAWNRSVPARLLSRKLLAR